MPAPPPLYGSFAATPQPQPSQQPAGPGHQPTFPTNPTPVTVTATVIAETNGEGDSHASCHDGAHGHHSPAEVVEELPAVEGDLLIIPGDITPLIGPMSSCYVCNERCPAGNPGSEFFRPCGCVEKVFHRHCFRQWRQGWISPKKYFACPDCMRNYNIERVRTENDDLTCRRKILFNYRIEVAKMWAATLSVVALVVVLVSAFTYAIDRANKNVPVVVKYMLSSVIVGWPDAGSKARWRTEFHEPTVPVWPYYALFGVLIASVIILIGFVLLGCQFESADRPQRPCVGQCSTCCCDAPTGDCLCTMCCCPTSDPYDCNCHDGWRSRYSGYGYGSDYGYGYGYGYGYNHHHHHHRDYHGRDDGTCTDCCGSTGANCEYFCCCEGCCGGNNTSHHTNSNGNDCGNCGNCSGGDSDGCEGPIAVIFLVIAVIVIVSAVLVLVFFAARQTMALHDRMTDLLENQAAELEGETIVLGLGEKVRPTDAV